MNVYVNMQMTALWKAEQTSDYLKDSFFNHARTWSFWNDKTLVSMSNKTFAKRKTKLDECSGHLPALNWRYMILKSITIKPYIDGALNNCCSVASEIHQVN